MFQRSCVSRRNNSENQHREVSQLQLRVKALVCLCSHSWGKKNLEDSLSSASIARRGFNTRAITTSTIAVCARMESFTSCLRWSVWTMLAGSSSSSSTFHSDRWYGKARERHRNRWYWSRAFRSFRFLEGIFGDFVKEKNILRVRFAFRSSCTLWTSSPRRNVQHSQNRKNSELRRPARRSFSSSPMLEPGDANVSSDSVGLEWNSLRFPISEASPKSKKVATRLDFCVWGETAWSSRQIFV